jgi:DNA polymerase III subunit alpha
MVYTQYTKPEGTIKFDELVHSARKKGIKFLAMTDHGNFSGISEFYSKCIDSGIKPIIGMDFFCRLNNGRFIRVITYIKSYRGYKSILTIVENLKNDGKCFFCDIGMISGLNDCFITISSYRIDKISESVDIETDPGYINSQLTTSGINTADVFFHILYDETIYNETVTKKLIEYRSDKTVRLLASNPVYYLEEGGHGIKNFALRISEGDPSGSVYRHQFLGSTEKEFSRFPAESIPAINEIVSSCNFRLEEMPVRFPDLKLKRKIEYSFFETLKNESQKIIHDQSDACKEIIREELAYIRKHNIADIILFMIEVKTEFIEKFDQTLFFSGFVNDLHLAYLFNLTLSSPVFAAKDYHRSVMSEKKIHPLITVLVSPESRENLFVYLSERFSDDNVCFLTEYVKWRFGTILALAEKELGIDKETADSLSLLYSKYSRSQDKYKEFTVDSDFDRLSKKTPGVKELTEYLISLDETFRNYSCNTNQVVISRDKISGILPVTPGPSNSGIKSSFLNMSTAKYFGVWNINIESNNYLNVRKHFRLGPIKETNLDNLAKELILRIKKDDLGMIPYFSFNRQREVYLSVSDNLVCDLVLYNESGRTNFSYMINRPSPEHPKKWYKKELENTRGFIVFREQLYFICDKLFRSKELNYLRRRLLESSGPIQFNSILNQISETEGQKEKCEYLRSAVQPSVFYLSLSESLIKVVIALRILELKLTRKRELVEFIFSREVDQDSDWRRYITEMKNEGYVFNKFSLGFITAKISIQDRSISLPLYCIRGISPKISEYIFGFVSSEKIDSFQDFLEKSNKDVIKHNMIELLIKVGFFDLFNPNRKELELINDKYFKSLKKENLEQPGLFETFDIEMGTEDRSVDYTPQEKQDMEDSLTGIIFTKKEGAECELCGIVKLSEKSGIIPDSSFYIKYDFRLHLSLETTDGQILNELIEMTNPEGNCDIEIFFSDTKESIVISKFIRLEDIKVYRIKRLLKDIPFYIRIKEKRGE